MTKSSHPTHVSTHFYTAGIQLSYQCYQIYNIVDKNIVKPKQELFYGRHHNLIDQ